MDKSRDETFSITGQATRNVHQASILTEKEKQIAAWRNEADELERMLEHIQSFIEGQTGGAIAGVKLDMRERILSELLELQSSLTFARIEALRELVKLGEGD